VLCGEGGLKGRLARMTTILGHELNLCGCQLDIELLHNGGLLHDIAKQYSQHEGRGGELLYKLGLNRLAPIVAGHGDVATPGDGRLTEKDLVCGTRRVTVTRRFNEKIDLYRDDAKACLAINSRTAKALVLPRMVDQILGRHLDEVLTPEDPS